MILRASQEGLLRRGLWLVIIVVAAVLLLWLVLTRAAVALSDAGNPRLASILGLEPPSLLVGEAAAKLNAGERLTSIERERLVQSLTRAPLNSHPFAALGALRARSGDQGGSAALMKLALRREPRDQAVRAWLLDHHLRAGEVAEALEQADRLMMLNHELRPGLLKMLAILSSYADTEKPLKEMLARDQAWRPNYFEALVAQPVDSAILADFIRSVPRPKAREHQVVIEELLDRGEVALARAIWAQGASSPAASGVYDPNFKGLSGAPPFNWNLRQSDSGAAEIGVGRGLILNYLSSAETAFAEQSLALKAGRYRLRSAAADVPGRAGRLLWRLTCEADGQKIADVDVSSSTRESQPFTVASDCPIQKLSLRNERSEFSELITSKIDRIDVVPLQ